MDYKLLKEPLATGHKHIYTQDKQTKCNKRPIVMEIVHLPDGNELVRTVFGPMRLQINRIRNVITFSCQLL